MKKIYSLFLMILFPLTIISLTINNYNALAIEGLPNNIYAGMGLGSNLYNGHSEFLLSLNYNHVFEYTAPKLSIGLLIEGIFSSRNACAFGLPIGFYATDHLKFWVTPSYVINGEKKIMEDNEHFEYGDKFMLSINGGYIFPLVPDGRYTIMPFIGGNLVNYEFILSLGVKFGLNLTDSFR